jgi:hypothetical protein
MDDDRIPIPDFPCSECGQILGVGKSPCDECNRLMAITHAERRDGDREAERWLRNHVIEALNKRQKLHLHVAAWLIEWIIKQPWGTRSTLEIETEDLTESDVERIYEQMSPLINSPAGQELKRILMESIAEVDKKH